MMCPPSNPYLYSPYLNAFHCVVRDEEHLENLFFIIVNFRIAWLFIIFLVFGTARWLLIGVFFTWSFPSMYLEHELRVLLFLRWRGNRVPLGRVSVYLQTASWLQPCRSNLFLEVCSFLFPVFLLSLQGIFGALWSDYRHSRQWKSRQKVVANNRVTWMLGSRLSISSLAQQMECMYAAQNC